MKGKVNYIDDTTVKVIPADSSLGIGEVEFLTAASDFTNTVTLQCSGAIVFFTCEPQFQVRSREET